MNLLPMSSEAIQYIVIIALSSFLVIILYYFVNLFTKSRVPKDTKEELRDDSYKKALEILDEARVKSLRLLTESQQEAQFILKDAQEISKDTKATMSENIDSISRQQIAQFENLSRDLLNAYKEALNKEVVTEIGSFKQIIKEETIESQQKVDEEIKKEYEELKKELENYRREQLARIEKSIYIMIAEISKDILGHAMTLDEHQDLVMKILEDAKEKAKFNL